MHSTSSPLEKSGFNLFNSLNFQQDAAVKEVDCPLLIIAGAGSGKTFTVASKIAYLIKEGVQSESILALTFNQKAAEELKERVTGLVGVSEDLNISTFHSFCNQVIQDNILSTKLNANFRIITDTAQLVYLTKNINSFGIEYLEFNDEPYTLAREIKKFISRCKDELVTPEDLQLHVEKSEKTFLTEEAQEKLSCLKDVLKIYRAYEDYKLGNNLLDFGDLLYNVYNLLKNKPLILNSYQEKFKYVIVDEFQDTNYIQLQIVNLLASKHGHITVVGDDDQSIYQFRGAHLTNISEFKKIFPKYAEKALEHNYRSTKKIVAVANTLIEKSPERTIKKLFTDNPEGNKVVVVETLTDTDQVNYILEVTKELLKQYQPQDIAILCRRRVTAEPIVNAFRKQAIPFNFIGETGFFQEPIIKDVIAFLKVLSNPLTSNVELVRILNRRNYGITQVDICKFNSYAKQRKISLYETFEHLDKIDVDKYRFLAVKQTLSEMLNDKKRQGALDLVHDILFEHEFYKYELALKSSRNIQLLNQFYVFVEEYNSIYPDKELEDFTDYLSYASNFEVDEKTVNAQAVVISTIHSVKGMQYPVVIIPDVNEQKLPTKHYKDKFEIPTELLKGIQSAHNDKELHIQEERRLFYVAITRAKEKIVITYAKNHGENKTETKPSRFLQEINYQQNENILFQQVTPKEITVELTASENQIETELLHQIIANITTRQYNKAIENVLLIAKSINKNLNIHTEIINKIKEPTYTSLEQVIEKPLTVPLDHVFSVSQFDGYKKCPRLYQYRYIMKIPEKPKRHLRFGSTIHSIVEQLTKMQKEKQFINETIAGELLDKFWSTKSYKTDIQAKKDYEDAKNILRAFLDDQKASKTEILDIERSFETAIGNVRVEGRIDRIDKDETGFTVIDYKTSKKTSSLSKLKGDMQLLVYALAFKTMYDSSGKQLKVGDWFLRHNKKVFFIPEKQAIDDMQIEIQELAKKISSAEFEPKKSWECKRCDYKCLCD
jgi:DNA helicase-2/ATP-dependent DNA helicase PcrA